MKQTLRIVIPLLVLVAVVFGVTYFSQYTRKAVEQEITRSPEPPLRFGSSIRAWNPFGTMQERVFPGFYERQGNAAGPKNTAGFWFENRNNSSVTLRLKGVSCSSCSGGRVAPIPPKVTREILQMSVLQSLPQGLTSALPIGMAWPTAHLFDPEHKQIAWQSYDFRDNPRPLYNVPAVDNPDGWTPQWGILELLFSVGEIGTKTLSAEFEVHNDATGQFQSFQFQIAFEGVEPFSVAPKEIKTSEIRETTKPQNFEILVYSATRGPDGNLGDLATPISTVEMPSGSVGEPGPFIAIGTPVRVPDSELLPMSLSMSEAQKRPARVMAAYRVPVTINPQVGDKKIDLGPLDRVISLTVPNTLTTKTVPVSGLVRGGVWLDDDRRELRLSDSYSRTTTETYRLVTDKPDADVVLVPSECSPSFMKVSLEKLPSAPDRGYHNLKVVVPAESKRGPWGGMIVLQLNGPAPQRIRIPVHGKGG